MGMPVNDIYEACVESFIRIAETGVLM